MLLSPPGGRALSALSILLPSLLLAATAAAQTPKIADGTVVGECGFGPQVVSTDGVCTGTLIHPQIVLYAGHCNWWDDMTIYFTHLNPDVVYEPSLGVSEPVGQAVSVDYCKLWETDSDKHDIGFCVLDEPVDNVPIIPPAAGCELDDYLKTGQAVTITGFGDTGGTYLYDKRFASSFITDDNPRNPGTFGVLVGPNSGQSACNGDSGGPLLVQVADGSWRVLGNLSSRNGTCGTDDNSNNYASIEAAVPWIEQESGIDITPCHNSDGTWNPTSKCGGFYAGPRDTTAYGTWDNWCEGTPRSGKSASCGDPYDGELTVDSGSSGGSSGSGGNSGSGGGSGTGGTTGGTSGNVATGGTTASGETTTGTSGGLPSGETGGAVGDPLVPGAGETLTTDPALAGYQNSGSDAGCGCTTAGSRTRPSQLGLLGLLGFGWLVVARRRPAKQSRRAA